MIQLNGSTVGCRSVRQTTPAHSTAEAELVAASWCAREVVGLRNLLQEVFPTHTINIKMLGDNDAANLIASCQAGVRRVRHLDLASLYVRTITRNGEVTVEYIDTNDNIADLLTKVIGHQKLPHLNGLMGFVP